MILMQIYKMLQITACKILPDYYKHADLQCFYTSMKIFYTSKKMPFCKFSLAPSEIYYFIWKVCFLFLTLSLGKEYPLSDTQQIIIKTCFTE